MSRTNATTKPSSSSIVYPKIINHIAVSVLDLDQAVKWYKEVLGFNMIAGPVEFVADDSLTGRSVRDIHGPELKKMRIAWLSSGNHVANIEDLCHKISYSGGKQRSKVWEIVLDKGYNIVFCEDPFGNTIEIYSNSYEQTITSLV